MRLSELMEEAKFVTRLTNRKGTVLAHTESGVKVTWEDTGDSVYLHPDVVVDAE